MSFKGNGFYQPNLVKNIAQGVINRSNARDAARFNREAAWARSEAESNKSSAEFEAKRYISVTFDTLTLAADRMYDAIRESPKSAGELIPKPESYRKAAKPTPTQYARNRLIIGFPGTKCRTTASIAEKREAMIYAYSYVMWGLAYLYDRTAITNACRHIVMLHTKGELSAEDLTRYTTTIGRRVNLIEDPQASMTMFSDSLRGSLTYSSETAIQPELNSFPDYMARSAISRQFLIAFGDGNTPIDIEFANQLFTKFHPLIQKEIPLPKQYVAILNSSPA